MGEQTYRDEILAALEAARPHIERVANTSPTEPGRSKRQREAADALRKIDAALALLAQKAVAP